MSFVVIYHVIFVKISDSFVNDYVTVSWINNAENITISLWENAADVWAKEKLVNPGS